MLELFKLAIERKLDFIFKLVKRWDRCLRGCRQRGVNGLFTRYTERVLMIQTPSVFASGAWGRNKGKTKLYVHGKIEGKLEGNIEKILTLEGKGSFSQNFSKHPIRLKTLLRPNDGAKDASVDASHVA